MNKRGLSLWDILAVIILGLILLWLIPKVFGAKKFKDATIKEINNIKTNCIKNHSE